MRRGFYFIIGGFFIVWIMVITFYHYNVLADDLIDKAMIIVEEENGYISSLEEDQHDNGNVLSDNFGKIVAFESNDEDEITEDQTDNSDGNILSEDQAEDEQDMNNSDFQIMCIFCFGLCAGVIVGHFLTGFIK